MRTSFEIYEEIQITMKDYELKNDMTKLYRREQKLYREKEVKSTSKEEIEENHKLYLEAGEKFRNITVIAGEIAVKITELLKELDEARERDKKIGMRTSEEIKAELRDVSYKFELNHNKFKALTEEENKIIKESLITTSVETFKKSKELREQIKETLAKDDEISKKMFNLTEELYEAQKREENKK